jgi:hypothetical protein
MRRLPDLAGSASAVGGAVVGTACWGGSYGTDGLAVAAADACLLAHVGQAQLLAVDLDAAEMDGLAGGGADLLADAAVVLVGDEALLVAPLLAPPGDAARPVEVGDPDGGGLLLGEAESGDGARGARLPAEVAVVLAVARAGSQLGRPERLEPCGHARRLDHLRGAGPHALPAAEALAQECLRVPSGQRRADERIALRPQPRVPRPQKRIGGQAPGHCGGNAPAGQVDFLLLSGRDRPQEPHRVGGAERLALEAEDALVVERVAAVG